MDISEAPGPHLRIALKGRLDTTGADRIETRLSAAIVPRGLSATVDLSGVEFIGSMGVRMLISIARAVARKELRLVLFAPQEGVREVFDSVSLGDLIPIRDTEADAIAALQA